VDWGEVKGERCSYVLTVKGIELFGEGSIDKMMNDAGENSQQGWMRALELYLKERGDIQAIAVDRSKKTVSVATFGKQDLSGVEGHLKEVLKDLSERYGDGQDLENPAGKDGLWIRRETSEAVFEKTQCPAVRSLWTWREYHLPEEEEEEPEEEWQFMAILAGICGVGLVSGWVLQHLGLGPWWLSYVLYSVALISGGWDAAVDTFENLKKAHLDIHFLMLAVAVGAVAIGSWAEGALLLFLFSMSGALEHFAEHRTHREISSLTKAAPKTAQVVLDNGDTEERDVELVQVGDTLRVKPDELFPVDGEVIDGKTAADESNLTGEAVPVNKELGDTVFSGTLNLWGAVHLKVTQKAAESSLQKIIRMIRDAQHLKAPSQNFTDKFGTRYTYLILSITTLYFLFSWLVLGLPAFSQPVEGFSAFYRAMTFLVVASPCALVLSIPSAILAAIAWGARKGVLFRGGAAIEKLAEVDVVAMDKTGTLTRGDLSVVKVESFPEGREQDVLEWAFSLEQQSNHPIARAIVDYGKKQGLQARKVDDFQSFSGRGLKGSVGEDAIFLGRRELMDEGPLKDWISEVDEPPPSITEVWVFHQNLMGRILLEDTIRERSGDTLRAMEALGLTTMMLTGDRRSAAESVASQLGIHELRAGLLPEDKVAAIKEMSDAGKKVAMVGDGVNDAPSLAAAYVAVAMGARGSDAALEQSDVVLMNDKIERFLSAFLLSRKAKRIIKQNLVISLGTVILMAGAALLGIVPLTLGVFAHEGSTVVVCLNSMRLLMGKEE